MKSGAWLHLDLSYYVTQLLPAAITDSPSPRLLASPVRVSKPPSVEPLASHFRLLQRYVHVGRRIFQSMGDRALRHRSKYPKWTAR
jgi:hypothetical protein